MSTVISALTPNSVVTRVGMILGHPMNKNRVMVVVEGNDDKKVYGRLFDKNTVEVYPLGSCNNFDALLSTLNPKFYPRLAVIKDADFEHIVGYEYTYPNLFRTDAHDVESMMMTDVFYEAFKMEFLDGDDDLLKNMMAVHTELLPLSWLKLSCKELKRSIDFGTFTLYNFYKGDAAADLVEITKVLNKIPENVIKGVPTMSDIDDVKKKYGAVDDKQLNNGHDLCSGFAYKFKVLKGGKSKLNIDSMTKVLRTAFTMAQFSKTHLYSTMYAWAEKEGLHIFRERNQMT